MVIHKSQYYRIKPFLLSNGSVELDALLNSGEFSVGTAADRSYAPIIDNALAENKSNYISVVRAGSNLYGGLLQMLYRKRIDLTFGFPIETTYLAKQLHLENQFRLIPIANMEPWSSVYVSAPKTPWGENVLLEIETIFLISRNRCKICLLLRNLVR